jgi:hypothetical protein
MSRPIARTAKILVVEDSYLLAELISNCLRDWELETLGPCLYRKPKPERNDGEGRQARDVSKSFQ